MVNTVSQRQNSGEATFQFVDNRYEAIEQRKLQDMANNSPQAKQAAQLRAMADNHSVQHHHLLQKKENNTGLPDNLKSGVENLSGYSMDDVKVHYNSDKPAQLNAHAYAQGTDIHLSSGQEKHLPHEAWHVVQQKHGRVKPTMQMKGILNINDDEGLEKEADMMGAKALQTKNSNQAISSIWMSTSIQRKERVVSANSFPTTIVEPVVQLAKYTSPVALKNAMKAANEFKHLTHDQIESVSKEFPNWYLLTYKKSYKIIDFSNDSLRNEIDKMILMTDAFTDFEGQSLSDRINETNEDKLLVGYRARGENGTGVKASMPFGDKMKIPTQIGDGLYIAKDKAIAMEYAKQYVNQGMIGVIQEVYLNVNMIKETMQLKGISIKEWWNQYDTTNNDTWDVLVASISGKVGAIQYKVNPKHKESGLFELRDVEPVTEL